MDGKDWKRSGYVGEVDEGDEVGAGHYPPANSMRGNADNKDGYYYIAITFTYRSIFDAYKRIAGLPAYKRDKKVGCPASRQ